MSKRRTFFGILAFLFIISALLVGILIPDELINADFTVKNMPPSLDHIFGTDWLGRDMFLRTIKGLSLSIVIGMASSLISVLIAVILGMIAGSFPKYFDSLISLVIDLLMGIPHIVLLILISFAVGRGFKGVFIGIALTHWTSLSRVVRGEVLQIRNEHYIKVSRKMGKSSFWIMKNHILPFVVPQAIVGGILLFPHAILHESSVTFLGFGLSPETPAIGIILSESMRYIATGYWWLAFFPGAMLVVTVILFDILGDFVKSLIVRE